MRLLIKQTLTLRQTLTLMQCLKFCGWLIPLNCEFCKFCMNNYWFAIKMSGLVVSVCNWEQLYIFVFEFVFKQTDASVAKTTLPILWYDRSRQHYQFKKKKKKKKDYSNYSWKQSWKRFSHQLTFLFSKQIFFHFTISPRLSITVTAAPVLCTAHSLIFFKQSNSHIFHSYNKIWFRTLLLH